MNNPIPFSGMLQLLNRRPQARAVLRGSHAYPNLLGNVYFYQMSGGVIVAAQVTGLPEASSDSPGTFFGFHIHNGSVCSGTDENPFADALTHYNPQEMPHPNHAGDVPPLLGNHGYALQVFYTDRFTVREILHRTVIIHARPDDFTTQPAGNAGEKIACGEIKAVL